MSNDISLDLVTLILYPSFLGKEMSFIIIIFNWLDYFENWMMNDGWI